MTYEQVKGMIADIATELKCEYAYSAFKGGKRNRFLIFFYGDSDDLFADNENYQSIETLVIEFYSPNKDIKAERKIQQILNAHEITYDKTTTFISDEHINMTTYTTEVLINEQQSEIRA